MHHTPVKGVSVSCSCSIYCIFLDELLRTPFGRSSEKAPSGLPQDCHQARDVAVRGPSGAASGNRKRRQHEKVPRPSLVLIGAYDSRRAWRGSATRIRLYLDGYVTRYAQPCISIQYHNVWGRTRGVQVRRNHPRALGGWCLFASALSNDDRFMVHPLTSLCGWWSSGDSLPRLLGE